jgi:hypothetical protein
VEGTWRPLRSPKGYYLDLASDPDAPALRRPDGAVVARFSARGVTEEAIERVAMEDLLYRSEEPQRDRDNQVPVYLTDGKTQK